MAVMALASFTDFRPPWSGQCWERFFVGWRRGCSLPGLSRAAEPCGLDRDPNCENGLSACVSLAHASTDEGTSDGDSAMWALLTMPTPVILPAQLSRDTIYRPGTTRAEEYSHGTLTRVYEEAGLTGRGIVGVDSPPNSAPSPKPMSRCTSFRDGGTHCQCPECGRVSMHGSLYAR